MEEVTENSTLTGDHRDGDRRRRVDSEPQAFLFFLQTVWCFVVWMYAHDDRLEE